MSVPLIVSTAHEWYQALPLSAATLSCARCRARVPISDARHAERCSPHYEAATSGWRAETGEGTA